MNAPSVARAASSASSSRSRARIRSRISAAAFSVKVIVRIELTSSPSSNTERTNRSTSTDVLPLPAPASSSRSPSRRSIATSCSSVNARSAVAGSERSSTTDPGEAATVARARRRARLELPGAQPRGQRQRAGPGVVEHFFELGLVPGVVGDEPAAGRRSLQVDAARPQVAAPEGLVKATHRFEAQELAHRQHVQRDLKLAVGRPPGALMLRAGRAALVVAHDGPRLWPLIYSIDDPAQANVLAGFEGRQRGGG